MNRKTIEGFPGAEFENDGASGTVKGKKGRRSVILPLILSVIGAIAIWLYVIASNNTCSAIPVTVNGNEQLMSSNYTVSSVEPASVDVVLRGKKDVVSQIISDKSMITAYIDVFGKPEDSEDSYLFASTDEIKEGEYTVDVQFTLPDGVTCSTKSVTVTIARSYSKTFKKEDFKVSFKNYSVSEEYVLSEETVKEESLTVSGDETTVSSIAKIGLNVDWQSEITGDVDAVVTPVAYDDFGGEIDSTFLHFEPETLNVCVSVNKVKTFSLVLKTADNDTGAYTLSRETVQLVGPTMTIDSIGSEIVLNADQDLLAEPTIRESYEFDASRFSSAVMIRQGEEYVKSTTVRVGRTERMRSVMLSIPSAVWKVIAPENLEYEFYVDQITVMAEYMPRDKETSLAADDLLVLVDMSGKSVDVQSVQPIVTVLSSERFGYVRLEVSELPVIFHEKKTEPETQTEAEKGNE